MTGQMEAYLRRYAKCLLPVTLGVTVNLDQLCFDALANDVDGYELKQGSIKWKIFRAHDICFV